MGFNEATVRAAFDAVGASIETTAATNPVNGWMRNRSRREALATFPRGSSLLEIGCGTGADASFLAAHGYRIAALDISDRMVDLARERVRSQGLGDQVLLWRGRLADVAHELAGCPWAPFDGAFANFSLTYEDALRPVAEAAHGLVKAGGWFLFTLPNKLCVSEAALALARARWADALGRLREPRWATVRGSRIRVHAYTPAEVRQELRGLFELQGTVGVPVFMPPPSLYDPGFERMRSHLEAFDNRLAARFPWRVLGDTTLFKFRKAGP